MGAEPRHPAAGGPPPSPACDWLGGRVCPPRRGGEGPLRAPGGRRQRTGRRERGPQGASEGAGEPGSGDPRAGSERGRVRRAGERAGGERKPGGLRAAARCTARSPDRQPAPPRSLPGGSGAGSGRSALSGSLTCRRPAAPPAGRAQAGRRGGEEPGRRRRSPAAWERLGALAGRRLHGDRARGADLRTFGRRGERRPLPSWDSPGSSCPAPAGGGDPADPWGARLQRLRRNLKGGCALRRGPGWGGGWSSGAWAPSPQRCALFVNKAARRPSSRGSPRRYPLLGVGGGLVRLSGRLIPLLSLQRLPGCWATFRLAPLQPGSP